MKIAALIYENFTLLDLVGPLEVLTLLPDVECQIAATKRGPVWPDNAVLPVIAPFDLVDVLSADLLLIPGGSGTVAALGDYALVECIKRLDAATRQTCSVCTGSLLLGAAGLLTNREATTHWAMVEMLASFGATPVMQRWVKSDKYVTAAGVSAGIDMALHLAAILAGETVAKAIQLAIEYDPAPPFAAGSPEKAGSDIIEAVSAGETALVSRAERVRADISFLKA